MIIILHYQQMHKYLHSGQKRRNFGIQATMLDVVLIDRSLMKRVIWNAEFNAGKVVRYDKNGDVDMIIHVPEPYVTCATFGGDNLDVLYITTSTSRMSEEEKNQ